MRGKEEEDGRGGRRGEGVEVEVEGKMKTGMNIEPILRMPQTALCCHPKKINFLFKIFAKY